MFPSNAKPPSGTQTRTFLHSPPQAKIRTRGYEYIHPLQADSQWTQLCSFSLLTSPTQTTLQLCTFLKKGSSNIAASFSEKRKVLPCRNCQHRKETKGSRTCSKPDKMWSCFQVFIISEYFCFFCAQSHVHMEQHLKLSVVM